MRAQRHEEVNRLMHASGALRRPPINPTDTALVIIDMVNWQVPRATVPGTMATSYFVETLSRSTIPHQQRLLNDCRELGTAVAFLRVGCYRRDYADATPALRKIICDADARDGQLACEVIPELSPRDGEISLIKTGSSGFATSALDSYLRNMGVQHVLYCGVITNGCVLLTLASGFDLGYHGYLVADSTTTFSEELQTDAEGIVGGFMAEVVSTDKILQRLKAASS